MAKMFYTLDEAKAALGKSEDEIKQFTRDGRLREFRDGPRLMFKADQVEALKGQLGSGGSGAPIDLGPSDSGAPIGLVDSKGGSGISLAESSGLSGLSGSGLANISGSGLGSGMGSGMMNLKEDTALAADLGLSGSIGGMPSPARGSGSGTGLSGSAGGSRGGINVFGDEAGEADPMAQTAISSSPSVADLNLEGIGSGSGLLDLTRESDDTSLGADLIDEIKPNRGARPSAPQESGAGLSGVGLAAMPGGVTGGGMGVRVVEAADPMAGLFGGLALGAAVVVVFGIFIMVSALLGGLPDLMKFFADKNFVIIAAIVAAPAVVFGIFGLVIGKSMAR